MSSLFTGLDSSTAAQLMQKIDALTTALQALKIGGFPIHLFPSADSEAFDFNAYVNLPAIAASADIIVFTVPAGFHGIIKRLGNNFVGGGFQEGAGGVVWQILADGVAIPNYDKILASLGTIYAPTEVSSIRVREGQKIELLVNNINIAVAGQLCGGRLGGWFYPVDQEPEDSWL